MWGYNLKRSTLFQVIDLAMCMLTYDSRKEICQPKTWFMPTTLTVNF